MAKRHYIPITSDVPGVSDSKCAFIRKVIRTALAAEGVDFPCEIDVRLTDDETIHEINREMREVDRATDVLSFPMFELTPGELPGEEDADPGTGLVPLGDMVISLEHVAAQAKEYGHSNRRELAYLVTHSVLHGYNYSPAEAPFPGWVRYGTFYNERNPLWRFFPEWISYKARLSTVLRNSDMQTDIALMQPLVDMWTYLAPQFEPSPGKWRPFYVNTLWEAVHQNGGGCDYLTVHVPSKADTIGMISTEQINLLAPDAVLINYARETIIDEDAVDAALREGKLSWFSCDFATPKTVKMPNTFITTHSGAGTGEAEANCADMAISELKDYLENGNIAHSVNYPACSMGKARAASRIACLHANVPNMIGQITAILAKDNANVQRTTNESAGENAYTMFDTDEHLDSSTIEALKQIPSMYRVRVIK